MAPASTIMTAEEQMLETSSNSEPTAMDALREKAQQTLLEAAKSGKVDEVIAKLRPPVVAKKEDTEALCRKAKQTILDGLASGELDVALAQLRPPIVAGPENTKEALRLKAAQTMMDAAASGELDAVLAKLRPLSDEIIFVDSAADAFSDDEPVQVSIADFLQTSEDFDKSGVRVLDQIQGKLVEMSDVAQRRMERVAVVVQHKMQVASARCKMVPQAARDKSEQLQGALPNVADTPKVVSQAATVQSERIQKNIRLMKVRTGELATETSGYVKDKTVKVKDATQVIRTTVSDKAHTGLDLIKHKASVARDSAQAVSTSVSEKAHTGLEVVKEKAGIARGMAHAVSTTVSQTAQTGFEKAKETAKSMREGNCMQSMHTMPPHVIRRRGGA
mmetsp:Transcript_19441/g.34671  ORF Transcript_19441/g.34671 Transcript_19441/m.34671 type:complete len:390 (+) Transcript_19441:69-1238(+)